MLNSKNPTGAAIHLVLSLLFYVKAQGRVEIMRSGHIRPPPLPDGPQPIPEEKYRRLERLVHPRQLLQHYNYIITSPTSAEITSALKTYTGVETCRRCRSKLTIFDMLACPYLPRIESFFFKDLAWNRVSEEKCRYHPGKCSVVIPGKVI